MKNALFVILFTAVTFCSNAQDSTITLSKFEETATTAGIVRKFTEKPIGTIKGLNVTVLRMTNFSNGDTSSVIRISSNYPETQPIIGSNVLYFLKEDAASVIKLLEYYSSQIVNNQPPADAYFSFTTSNDIQVLCKHEERYFSDSFLSIRKVYKHLRTPVGGSGISFNNKKDIDKLISLLKEALTEV